MLTYGIDPGLTGAIAVLRDGRLEAVADLPASAVGSGRVVRRLDAAALAAIVRAWRRQLGVDAERAAIERVASMPGQGVASVFSLGHTAGVCEAVLLTLGIPVDYVQPSAWKRSLGITAGADKTASVAIASREFPAHAGMWTRARDHNRAEAALIGLHWHRSRA